MARKGNYRKNKTLKKKSKTFRKRCKTGSRKIQAYLTKEEKENGCDFNFHHRKPRCQGGGEGNGNLIRIDIYSHDAYTKIVKIAAGHYNIEERMVSTEQVVEIINIIYPIFKKIYDALSNGDFGYLDIIFGIIPNDLKNETPLVQSILPSFKRLMCFPDSNKVKKLDLIAIQFTRYWFPKGDSVKVEDGKLVFYKPQS